MTQQELSKRTARLPLVPNENFGINGDMYHVKRLEPLPISFDPVVHRYTWQPTGEVMSNSVTGILKARKDARLLQIFEDTKHIWEPRGNAIHKAMELFLNGTDPDDLLGGDYDDWLKPAFRYPMWEHMEVIATEYSLVDLKRGIGGQLDLLAWDHLMDRMCLIDFKSTGKSKRHYNTAPQLGAYCAMLIDCRKLVVDELITVWISPGETHIGFFDDDGKRLDSRTEPSPAQCLEQWEEAYSFWQCLQEEI